MFRKLTACAAVLAAALTHAQIAAPAWGQPTISRPESLPAGVANARAISTLTISSGSVTAAQQRHLIETEGASASDDLTTVVPPSWIKTGDVINISIADAARTVTLKNGSGANLIETPSGVDWDVARLDQDVPLRWTGTQWRVMTANEQIAAPYDVTRFGAKGDGSTVNTTFLQAAIDAAENQNGTWSGWITQGRVTIPCGVYKTGPLTITKPVEIEGAGKDCARLELIAGATGALFEIEMTHDGGSQAGWPVAHVDIRNLHLHGPGKTDGGGANIIEITKPDTNEWTTRFTFADLIIFEAAGSGVKVTGNQNFGHLINVDIRNNNLDGFEGISTFDWKFTDSEFGVNQRDNLSITNGGNFKSVNSNYFSAGRNNVRVNSSQFDMVAGMIDDSAEHGLYVENLTTEEYVHLFGVELGWASKGSAQTYSDIYIASSNDASTPSVVIVAGMFDTPHTGVAPLDAKYNIEFQSASNFVIARDTRFQAGDEWSGYVSNYPRRVLTNRPPESDSRTISISGGAAAAPGRYEFLRLDSEGSSGPDTLTTLSGDYYRNNDIVKLGALSADKPITLATGGNLDLRGVSSLTLADYSDSVDARYIESTDTWAILRPVIQIKDDGGFFAAPDADGALQEVGAKLAGTLDSDAVASTSIVGGLNDVSKVAPQKRKKLYINAGQSNGTNIDSETVAITSYVGEFAPPPHVFDVSRGIDMTGFYKATQPYELMAVRQPMQGEGVGVGYFPVFGRALKELMPAIEDIALMNFAVGSTGFGADNWNPGDTEYEAMVAGVMAFLQHHPEYEVAGLFWDHGNNDTGLGLELETPNYADSEADQLVVIDAYQAAFKAMIDDFRARIPGAENMPVYIHTLPSTWVAGGGLGREAIQIALKTMPDVAGLDYIYVNDLDDLTDMRADGVHRAWASLKRIGERDAALVRQTESNLDLMGAHRPYLLKVEDGMAENIWGGDRYAVPQIVNDATRGRVIYLNDGTAKAGFWTDITFPKNAYTLFAWIKPMSAPSGAGLLIAGNATGGSVATYHAWGWQWSTLGAGDTTTPWSTGASYNWTSDVSNGVWSFAALTFDGTTHRVYVDPTSGDKTPVGSWTENNDPSGVSDFSGVEIGQLNGVATSAADVRIDAIGVLPFALDDDGVYRMMLRTQ